MDLGMRRTTERACRGEGAESPHAKQCAACDWRFRSNNDTGAANRSDSTDRHNCRNRIFNISGADNGGSGGGGGRDNSADG